MEDYPRNGNLRNGSIPNAQTSSSPGLRTRNTGTGNGMQTVEEEGTRHQFSLARAATSMFKPPKKVGAPPGVWRSIRSIILASCMWHGCSSQVGLTLASRVKPVAGVYPNFGACVNLTASRRVPNFFVHSGRSISRTRNSIL